MDRAPAAWRGNGLEAGFSIGPRMAPMAPSVFKPERHEKKTVSFLLRFRLKKWGSPSVSVNRALRLASHNGSLRQNFRVAEDFCTCSRANFSANCRLQVKLRNRTRDLLKSCRNSAMFSQVLA
jgi:hypothetical protein